MNQIKEQIISSIKSLKSDTLFLSIMTLGLILFIPSIYFDFFIFDDDDNIRKNLLMTNISFSSLLSPWATTKIPLSLNFWQLISFVFGNESATSFRIFSILIHLMNGLLVFKLAESVFKENKFIAKTALFLFLCHPINVQSVIWVSSQRELLATFFILISANIYSSANGLSLSKVIGMLLCWVISLLFKPITLVAPIIFCILYYFRRKNMEHISKDSKHIPIIIGLSFALFCLSTYLYIDEILKPEAMKAYSAQNSIITTIASLSHYLFNYFVPISLEFNYGLTPQEIQNGVTNPRNTFRLLIFFVPLIFAHFSRRKSEAYLSIIIFLLLILLNTGLIPFTHQVISTVTDRYMYLPGIGLVFLICFILSERKVNKLILSLGLITLSILTAKEVSLWKDNSSRLFSKNMNNEIKKVSYGQALIRDKKFEDAIEFMKTDLNSMSNESIAFKISLANAIPQYEISPEVFHYIKDTYTSAPVNFIPYFANLAYKRKDYKLARTLAIYASSIKLTHLLQFTKADLNILEDVESDKTLINALTIIYDKERGKAKTDFNEIYPLVIPYINDKDYFYKVIRNKVERGTHVEF